MPRLKEFPHLTEARRYRLELGVRLADTSYLSGISMARASLLERFPDKARPGELESLREAADRAAALRASGQGAA